MTFRNTLERTCILKGLLQEKKKGNLDKQSLCRTKL